jgi:hypothetical protein
MATRQAVKVIIKLVDTPYYTTIDGEGLGHSPVYDHLVKLGHADPDVSGSLFAGASARRVNTGSVHL